MKRTCFSTILILTLILAGCDLEKEPSPDSMLSRVYAYLDVEVASDYISSSRVYMMAGSDNSAMQVTTLSDGLQSSSYGNYYSSVRLSESRTLDCDDKDWGADYFCQDTIVLTGKYRTGVSLAVTNKVMGSSITSTFSVSQLPLLSSPIEGETYNVSTDSVRVSWSDTSDDGLYLLRIFPCEYQTTGNLLLSVELDSNTKSQELRLSDFAATCGYSEELSLEAGFMKSGVLDDGIAGGQFRVRVYSVPVTINLTQG